MDKWPANMEGYLQKYFPIFLKWKKWCHKGKVEWGKLGLGLFGFLIIVQSIFKLIQVFPILDSLKLSIGLPNYISEFIWVQMDSIQFFLIS